MQDNQGNSLIQLPPVREHFFKGCFILTLFKVEMIRVPVTLSDDARVCFIPSNSEYTGTFDLFSQHLYDEIERLSRQRLENVISESGVTAAVSSPLDPQTMVLTLI